MTQEYKEILLKDLCARLPYFLYVECYNKGKECFIEGRMKQIDFDTSLIEVIPPEMEKYKPAAVSTWAALESVKPYLRPLSTMTKEEEDEWSKAIEIELKALEGPSGHTVENVASSAFEIDFYNKYHFDYRGLIPMGLALEATADMYKTE